MYYAKWSPCGIAHTGASQVWHQLLAFFPEVWLNCSTAKFATLKPWSYAYSTCPVWKSRNWLRLVNHQNTKPFSVHNRVKPFATQLCILTAWSKDHFIVSCFVMSCVAFRWGSTNWWAFLFIYWLWLFCVHWILIGCFWRNAGQRFI